MISLNIDRFRVINHRFGLEAGDRLLVEVARRISGCLRRQDTVARSEDIVARIGADEFSVLLGGVSNVEDTLTVIDRIRDALATPFRVSGEDVSITACFGVTLRGRKGDHPQELLRHASIALSRAKERGPDSHHVFSAGVDSSEEQRLQLENELREAVGRGQLKLYWQPIVSLDDGAVASLEALLRWEHPERGLLSTMEFITVAEESGLILSIGRWVLREACRQAQLWRIQFSAQTPSPFGVVVNISERELCHPTFYESVRSILAETGLDPAGLELDISEGLLTRSRFDLRRLRSLGVKLSIDDFGTGNLSFEYLASLPVTAVKIDGAVVTRLGRDPEAATIVSAMLATAKSFQLMTIAEAIETAEQLTILKGLGCTHGQGYFFAHPLPADEMESMLEHDGLRLSLQEPMVQEVSVTQRAS